MDALVLTTCGLTNVLLHHLGQLDAALHVLVLHQLEEDVTLGRVGVEALVVLLVVFLVEDDGVLALGHLQVLDVASTVAVATTAAQRVGLVAAGNLLTRQGIDMDGDEKVGLGFVGHLGTLPQFQEPVGGTCIDHPHVRTALFHKPSEGEGMLQRQVLLLRHRAYATRVIASMSGVNDQRKGLGGTHRHHQPHHQYPYNQYLLQLLLLTSNFKLPTRRRRHILIPNSYFSPLTSHLSRCNSTPAPWQSAPIGGFSFVTHRSILVMSG